MTALASSASSTTSFTPPPPPPGSVDALGEHIAELSAYLEAATYRLLVKLREFDEREGWNGFRSCAHWLNWRVGLNLGAAREKMRVAHALAKLPVLSASMEKGEISYSKVRALTRVATPGTEQELLDMALDGNTAQVERIVRSWRRVDRIIEREREERRHASRYLETYTAEDGMVVIRGRLSPEAGAALVKAVDAAREQLYQESQEQAGAGSAGGEATAGQVKADALGLVAESALAAELDPGTRGDRFQVVVHVDQEALQAEAEGGIGTLEGVGDVSAETSRRLSCDAAKVEMRHAADGSVLDVGRRTRTIPLAMRRALAARDGGCRFPGCELKLCDAHHVEHWADGGETKLDNLVQLCRHHHRAVHEGGFTVQVLADGEVRFEHPNGLELMPAPPLPPLEDDPFDAFQEMLAAEAVDVDNPLPMPSGGMARPVQYGWAVEALLAMAARES
ncbi:MAG TPA: DUF222 domain-containing protein [Thermoanaerobaculia bacterium]|nr:DUF222 domain-containing protein [Thermoanaerobaculia bacterium]